MKTQVEQLEQSRVALEIEVEPSRVEEALDRAYRKVVKRINIPGFRRGRAPRPIVELRVGRAALLQEALEHLIPQAFREAVDTAKVIPVGDPSFDLLEAEDGKPLRFKAEVDVKPEVQLAAYKGLPVEKVIERIDDADVEEVLKSYQERHTQLVTSEKDEADYGDFAVIDFEGFIDGQPFQGGAAKGYTLELGSESFLPGFEDQLIGLKKGESRDVTITFPEEGYRDDLNGKEAVFKVTLQELKVKQIPDIDDELAKEAGEADTLAEWKEQLQKRLEEAAANDAEERMRQELLRRVSEEATVVLPASLVEAEARNLIEGVAFDLARQGIAFEDYLRESGQELDEIKEQLRPRAEERVKTALVVHAIAEKEEIGVEEEEINAELERLYNGVTERIEEAKANADQLRRIEDMVRTRKTLDLVLAEAQVSERWVDDIEEELAEEASEKGTAEEDGEPDSSASPASSAASEDHGSQNEGDAKDAGNQTEGDPEQRN